MNALRTQHGADLALAGRDDALPALAAMLNNDHLSELVGGALQVTRVRYKPRTSLLVAFVRTGRARDGYGWALSTAGNAKLESRARSSARHGGGIRLVRLSAPGTDAAIAVGSIEDDWALRTNLHWLEQHGLGCLGVARAPGQGLLDGTVDVLRYKPERRVVLLAESPGAPIVIKTAAQPADEDLDRLFHQRLRRHGVPVLPRLGGAACSGHGTSASPAWGDRNLAAGGGPGARCAGEALARLHGIPAPTEPGTELRSEAARIRLQLEATCSMIAALVPALGPEAAGLAERIHVRLEEASGAVPAVQVHGDFSADQVLVSGTDIRLIDFDRAGGGSPESDLGSFAAVEEMSQWRGTAMTTLHTANLLEGYVRAGGRFRPRAMEAWTALRLFAGSIDPFRDRRPDWAAELSRHLERAGELVP